MRQRRKLARKQRIVAVTQVSGILSTYDGVIVFAIPEPLNFCGKLKKKISID